MERIKRALEDLKCFLGLHEWHKEYKNHRGMTRYRCCRCGLCHFVIEES